MITCFSWPILPSSLNPCGTSVFFWNGKKRPQRRRHARLCFGGVGPTVGCPRGSSFCGVSHTVGTTLIGCSAERINAREGRNESKLNWRGRTEGASRFSSFSYTDIFIWTRMLRTWWVSHHNNRLFLKQSGFSAFPFWRSDIQTTATCWYGGAERMCSLAVDGSLCGVFKCSFFSPTSGMLGKSLSSSSSDVPWQSSTPHLMSQRR